MRRSAALVLAAATAAAGCQVVREVGTDTVRLVDTVTTVDTLVHIDTVTVRDSLSALGDALAASAAGELAGGAAPALPATPVATGAAPAAPATPAGTDSAAMEAVSAGAAAARTTRDTAPPPITPADTAELNARGLLVPVAGVPAARLPNTFNELRGSRRHEALDILAPRGTPVVAADAGRVTKMYTSAAGGTTLYAQDPTGRFIYYYAHLDRYDPRMREGLPLARGDTLGFVGSTGNASPETPHLHFAIVRVADVRQWWKGTPLDPQPLFR